MPNKKITCIVGKSGSGKTTIANRLELLGHKTIESYTTRPPRHTFERGHIFVTPEEFKLIGEQQGGYIAYTVFNGYEYGATRQQVLTHDTYVIDPSGVEVLSEKFGRENIVVAYIYAPDNIRFKRMVDERGEEAAKKRLEHDAKVFDGFKDYDLLFRNVGFDLDKVVTNLTYVIRTGRVEYID